MSTPASPSGEFLFGFGSGAIHGMVGELKQSFQSSSVWTGFAVASMLLGCAIGALAYGIHTVAAMVSVLFVLKYVYEAKGRELEQMED